MLALLLVQLLLSFGEFVEFASESHQRSVIPSFEDSATIEHDDIMR